MTSAWKTVWLKELKDASRDRRSVMAAMSYAFFGPMLMAVAFFAVVNQATSESDVEVSISGAQYAPELIQHLENSGIVQHETPEEAQIELNIPEDYQERIGSAQPITITIRADYSERDGSDARRRVESSISGYNQMVASARLMMRGISPEVMQAVTPARQDTATKESRAALIMGTVMVFVIMSVFFSGMNVAIDTSAGERERNSLEFLLAQPLTSADLVVGKALTSATFAMLGGVLTLAMIPIVFMVVPLEKLGIDVSFSFLAQAKLALTLVPVALFASFLQLLVSFLAKSFKEAQTYITFVMFAPMTLVFVLEFTRFSHPALAYLPITSQHQALMGSINGEPVAALPLLVGGIATLAIAAVIAFMVQWKLKSEKVVFGL